MKMKFNSNKILILTIILLLNNYISTTFIKNLKYKKSQRTHRNTSSKDFDLADKKLIVETHNELRNEIALSLNKNSPKLPFATNMIQMYYSDAIGKKSQDWANKKKFMHSKSAYRRQPDFACGENLFMSMMSGGKPKKNWKRAIKEWYGEIKNMAGKSVDSFSSGGPVTGHFTQVIWAHSYIVGCGYVQYNDGGWITQLYVCQYGPVGNILGMPIYKSSPTKACKCEAGLVCENLDYPGLCCEKAKCKKTVLDWSGKPYPGTNPNIV